MLDIPRHLNLPNDITKIHFRASLSSAHFRFSSAVPGGVLLSDLDVVFLHSLAMYHLQRLQSRCEHCGLTWCFSGSLFNKDLLSSPLAKVPLTFYDHFNSNKTKYDFQEPTITFWVLKMMIPSQPTSRTNEQHLHHVSYCSLRGSCNAASLCAAKSRTAFYCAQSG